MEEHLECAVFWEEQKEGIMIIAECCSIVTHSPQFFILEANQVL